MNDMEKMERTACRKLIKSGKDSISYRGTLFEVIDMWPGSYLIRANHPHLEAGVTRNITCVIGAKPE